MENNNSNKTMTPDLEKFMKAAEEFMRSGGHLLAFITPKGWEDASICALHGSKNAIVNSVSNGIIQNDAVSEIISNAVGSVMEVMEDAENGKTQLKPKEEPAEVIRIPFVRSNIKS